MLSFNFFGYSKKTKTFSTLFHFFSTGLNCIQSLCFYFTEHFFLLTHTFTKQQIFTLKFLRLTGQFLVFATNKHLQWIVTRNLQIHFQITDFVTTFRFKVKNANISIFPKSKHFQSKNSSSLHPVSIDKLKY